ncbi:MAG TPA: protein phosphatase CheZ [bacterium]|nr:protein phosphatase CheZ [bacterium]
MGSQSENKKHLPENVLDDIVKLVKSVDTMIQNFNSIRKPIKDSSTSVPKANQQLNKVTKETEKAANRMLDLVEGITDKEIETLSIVGDLLASAENLTEDEQCKLQKVQQNAEQVQNDTFLIMDSLQFQDITTQQIHHASSILDAIENEMHSLLRAMGEAFEGGNKLERQFDPNATMEDSKKRQRNIDDLIKSVKS